VEEYRDDADAAEELEREPDVEAPEVPEADALEQAAELGAEDDDEPTSIGDAPEADALEQRRVAGDADEDDWR
jgi:hypothetical protein